jgi:hypothetical protein
MKTILRVVLGVILLCLIGCGSTDPDYTKGKWAGCTEARMRCTALGCVHYIMSSNVQVPELITEPGKVDESKSAKWNAGYKDGFNEELNSFYQELNRH